ncbi:MAG TPA: dienelactone hydrolase family protein [Chitinophagaceae bacterium]|jgi:predicted peptidase|nr:dienelactone hydrolase family protein [Chitinophagaceae bacterium]
MKKLLAYIALTVLVSAFLSAQQKVIQLYDGPPPGSESWNWNEAENDNNSWQTKVVYNVTRPTLTVFAPEADKANGTAVIIAPGGGFLALSINSEGLDVAKWLVQKGVTCFVLKYRLLHVLSNDPTAEFAAKMGKKEFEDDVSKVMPLVIADGRNAIAWVRKHAAEYKIEANKIGMMGFSAGGTVASSTLFGYTKENRPDFAAPIYPFFPSAMIGSVANDAPPIFIVTATDDGLGLAPHSIDLYNKWLSTKHDAELHMYARGNHGFGMRKQNLPTDNWIERFYEWLGVQGLLTKKVVDHALDIYEKKEFVFAEGKTLPYRILYPANYDKTKKYPLLLFLHGAGERGNDNEKQLTWGSKLFITEENRKNFPAIIVLPQCPEESFWAVTKIDRTTTPFTIEFDYTAEPNWPLAAANELVKKISKEEGVDKSRIYISGLSMGGMGTFESVYRYPELYAAALPICGGGDVNHYDKRVAKVPFWVFHGAADAVVNVKLSQEMVEKLKSLKAEVRYSEYPGVNHDSWNKAFAEPDYLSWMLLHKKK